MRRFIFLILPYILFLGQILFGFDQIRKYLGIDKTSELVWLSIALFVPFGIIEYFKFTKPYKRFLHFEESKSDLLDYFFSEMNTSINGDFRMNIMIVKRPLCSALEPGILWGRKMRFFTETLTPIWASKEMNHSPDRGLRLTKYQGIAGKALKKAKPVVFYQSDLEHEQFNLNKAQLEMVSGLKFIYSFPIRPKRKGTKKVEKTIIGIINLDSADEKSLRFENDEDAFDTLTKKMRSMSELISGII